MRGREKDPPCTDLLLREQETSCVRRDAKQRIGEWREVLLKGEPSSEEAAHARMEAKRWETCIVVIKNSDLQSLIQSWYRWHRWYSIQYTAH